MKQTILFLSLFFCVTVFAQKIPNYSPDIQLENLGRGFVAYRVSKSGMLTTVCLSWRYFKTDSITTVFNVYKAPVTNGTPATPVLVGAATNATFYRYSEASDNAMCYFLHEVVDGVENPVPLAEYTLPAYNSAMGTTGLNYIEIPMQAVKGKKQRYGSGSSARDCWVYDETLTDSNFEYHPNDISFADLDGDGEMEIVVHRVGPYAQDNAQGGYTDSPVLQAYKLDGTFMWEINLGPNIREGAHYTQFLAYDFDGCGKAEVICKTAEGSRDALGKFCGEDYYPTYVQKFNPPAAYRNYNPNANYRNTSGFIIRGPEFLTIFNGETGAEITTIEYDPPRYSSVYNNGDEIPVLEPTESNIQSRWGSRDSFGNFNRVDRYLACVAYLDGLHPSAVMCRGYYTRTALVAYDFDGKELKKRWKFDTYNHSQYATYEGQGNHNLRVGDVDGDGMDEIIYGACAINNDGTGLYTTRRGHGDAMHLTDFIPERPGLEVFQIYEGGEYGTALLDARTGEEIFGVRSTDDVGRGMGTDITASYRGMEWWSARTGSGANGSGGGVRNSVNGGIISTGGVSMNMACWWDGDLLRELQDGISITKYNNGSATTLLNPLGVSSNNSTKANPCIVADILGDWREEMIVRTSNNKAIRIYMTDYTTNFRFHTFLHDPVYRTSVAYQNVAYNQPTHTGFYMGADLQNIFVPTSIEVAGNVDEYVIDPFFDAIEYQWSDGVTSKTDTLRRAGFPADGTSQKVKLTMNYQGYLFSDSINVSFAPAPSGLVKTAGKSNISLLNNPVYDLMKIAFEEVGLYDCYLYDMAGRLVMKTTIPVSGASVHSLDVSGLPAGAGIIEIRNDKIRVTEKFLKK